MNHDISIDVIDYQNQKTTWVTQSQILIQILRVAQRIDKGFGKFKSDLSHKRCKQSKNL